MSKLTTLIKSEYRIDATSKSFWLTTLLLPVFLFLLGGFIGYLGANSDAMQSMSEHTPHPGDDITGMQVLGMLSGFMLFMFITMYGSMIFQKVKTEKTNRIVEILVSCVPGRTVMMAKVITVGLLGLTQMAIWMAMFGAGFFVFYVLMPGVLPIADLLQWKILAGLLIAFLYFVGGYCFYGSLFAMAGAFTDRNNENQGVLSCIMVCLMVSFYIGIFSVDNFGLLTQVAFYVPFTSPTTGPAQSIGGAAPWWSTLISLIILYGSAYLTLVLAGKAYTSALLLKGKKLSVRDLVVFFRAK
ncbi:MAG: ABC transporter permease [Bacteroidales bacterium]|nr:ABC transporter permease [Bacteroidales bacterium]